VVDTWIVLGWPNAAQSLSTYNFPILVLKTLIKWVPQGVKMPDQQVVNRSLGLISTGFEFINCKPGFKP